MKCCAVLALAVLLLVGCGGGQRTGNVTSPPSRRPAYWSGHSSAEIERNNAAREIAWVARTYMQHAAAGDLAAAARLSTGDARVRAAFVADIRDATSAGIEELYLTTDRALAVSGVVYDNAAAAGQLVFQLERTDQLWQVVLHSFAGRSEVAGMIQKWTARANEAAGGAAEPARRRRS